MATSHKSGALAYTNVEATAIAQGTSNGTAVTVDGTKSAGLISTFGGALAAGVSATFVVNHSGVEADDIILIAIADGTTTSGTPVAHISNVVAGAFRITFVNQHASAALDDVVMMRWAILKFGPAATA